MLVFHNRNLNVLFTNYIPFTDILVGDELVIDGGMATFEVIEKVGNDLRCKCTDPGLLLPRAKLSFWRNGKLVERNFGLPTLSAKVNLKCSTLLLLFVRFQCSVALFFPEKNSMFSLIHEVFLLIELLHLYCFLKVAHFFCFFP